VTTEKTYVENLNLIVDLYLKPLRAKSQEQNPFITAAQVKAIFLEIEVIVKMHQVLYAELSNRFSKWSATSTKIGDYFLKMIETFKLYIGFVTNFDRALSILEECKKNPSFSEYMKPRENVRQLNSLLILPIQRVPRMFFVIFANSTFRIQLIIDSID
jgi:hypothetical protein